MSQSVSHSYIFVSKLYLYSFANNDINVLPRREPHTQHGLLTRILDILVDGSELSKFEEVEEVEAITQGSVQAGVKKSFCT